jgi:mannose-6-phosphate isomerase-like protein (cupin superfamily)
MKSALVKVLIIASVLSPVAAVAQAGKTAPTTATYIMKEDLDKISATEQSPVTRDENAKVVDLGYENFAVGVIHRGSTRIAAPPAPANGGGGTAAQVQSCGRTMATLPSGGTPGGITHDFRTEGYIIVSGGGTMFTDGYIVNGRHSDQNSLGGPNGPTCGGVAYDVKKVTVKVGDVVIVPPGVVHGWADIPDHVDYLSFRPSQGVMQAGWVNPTIAK